MKRHQMKESELAQIIDQTIRHLEQLKAKGIHRVTASPAAVEELSRLPAAPRPGREPRPPRDEAVAMREPPPLLAPLPWQPSADKEPRMAELRQRALACQKCPHLVRSRTQVVFGVGNLNAELMFVGEAPGADEDAEGEPFVGRAGQLLTRIIETMGFQRSDVYIANILKCRPDMPPGSTGNRKPTPQEMETCKPYLLEQIEIIRPKVLVALGATAMEGLLNARAPIGQLRGKWTDFRGIPVMPTFHPSYLLRNPADTEKAKVWDDMLQVMEKLGRPISEKQRGYFQSVRSPAWRATT